MWIFSRFLGVGAIATIVHYAILILGVQYLKLGGTTASAGGFSVSMCLNYALNYRYTFRSRRRHLEAFPRFVFFSGVGLGLNTLLMYSLLNYADLHYLVAQLAATALVTIWNFLANMVWTFGGTSDVIELD